MKTHYSTYLDLADSKPGVKVYVSPERITLHKLRGNGSNNLHATSDRTLVDCLVCLDKLVELEQKRKAEEAFQTQLARSSSWTERREARDTQQSILDPSASKKAARPAIRAARGVMTSYPAIEGEVVTQAHADWCESHGHAKAVEDGIESPFCPRCGEVQNAALLAPSGKLVITESEGLLNVEDLLDRGEERKLEAEARARRDAKLPKVHYAKSYSPGEEIVLGTPDEITYHEMAGGRGANGVQLSGDWDEVTCKVCLSWKKAHQDIEKDRAFEAAVDIVAAERNRVARAQDRGEEAAPTSAADISEFPPMEGWEAYDVVEEYNSVFNKVAQVIVKNNLDRLRSIAPEESHSWTDGYCLYRTKENSTPTMLVEIKHMARDGSSFTQWFDERGFSCETLDEAL